MTMYSERKINNTFNSQSLIMSNKAAKLYYKKKKKNALYNCFYVFNLIH